MDQTTAQEWYEGHKNGIFRYILSITGDPQLAEDVLHDTFVKLLTGGFRCGPGKEQAWLYRVARNLCYDRLRKAKREQAEELAAADADHRLAYIELIASLSPMEREIVTMKIVGGLTHREIGQVLGLTAAAAQKRYERALDTLRND